MGGGAGSEREGVRRERRKRRWNIDSFKNY
jgi:hypothetical protein